MSLPTFVATTGDGLACAERQDGECRVEHPRQYHPVFCIAAHPLHTGIVYAGTREGVLRSA